MNNLNFYTFSEWNIVGKLLQRAFTVVSYNKQNFIHEAHA